MRPPAWLVRATFAVYPEDVRDRYGVEIADLLDGSPRPWRDLGDVAWNAVLERVGTVRYGRLRPYRRQMLALVTFPAVFWVALLILLPTVAFGTLAVGGLVTRGRFGLGPDVSFAAFIPGGLVTIGFVAFVATQNARRWVDSLDVPAPAFLVPTLLGLGCLGVGILPPTVLPYFGGWATVPCWWLMVLVLSARYRTLIRHGRTGAARGLAVVGTPAVLAVTATVHLTTTLFPGEMLFWPMSLMSVLVVCTPFTFAILSAVTPECPRSARPPASRADGP
ncbi:hypothetical protein [Virgisporangium aurantiacum]|uniref:Uncharacterized protein n=1 Tax=Virgisporangium aurantiacum TaxID=175570 RepID=A0A8J3ZMJ9_9ACTN|nr:hypothetical protein [Virgisporangium aurantiacum]GIJ64281.1 hypothetical protein Vau01_117970 [Virgisporangium aurantiacum]